MARNNITTELIDLNTPQPTNLIAEPILAFKVQETFVFVQTKDVPSDYAESTFSFVEIGNMINQHLVLLDSNNNNLGFIASVDPLNPQIGEWIATYDSTQNETTFTFYFSNATAIVSASTLNLYYDAIGYDSVTLLPSTYQSFISTSMMTDSEKLALTEFLQVFFLQARGLPYAKLYIFDTYDKLKNYQLTIKNTDLVCINFYSADIDSFNDKNFRKFFIYNNETANQLTALSKNYINANGYSNIVMLQSQQQFMAAFISTYFGQVSSFYAANPKAFELQGINPILDENIKTFYRDNNVNFYTLVNEDLKDGNTQIKNGLCLDGNPIDKVTVLNWIVLQSNTILYNTYTQNGSNNSKISALQATGDSPSVYSAALEVMYTSFLNAGYILGYDISGFKIAQTQELSVTYNSTTQYNSSIDVLKHIITNQAPSLTSGI